VDALISSAMTAAITASDQARPFDGARILVVEDEYFIADDLRRMLSKAGAQVVGPVATLKAAQESLDNADFDWAIIDLNLRGESAVPIADRLLEQGKRVVIATGYDSGVLPERLKTVPRVEKPFDEKTILPVIEELSGR
jgi:DNA-binding NtrC family response regulator